MIIRLTSLAVISIVSLIGMPALGQDFIGTNSSYPGSNCLPLKNSYNYNIKEGGMYNTDGSTRQWNCPITRLSLGGIIATAYTYVKNLSKSSLSCAFNVRRAKGNSIKVYTKKVSPSSSVQRLAFEELQYAIGSDYYYYFLCSIPGKNGSKSSGIVSYDVIEVGIIIGQ